jgi:hypothetical protein
MIHFRWPRQQQSGLSVSSLPVLTAPARQPCSGISAQRYPRNPFCECRPDRQRSFTAAAGDGRAGSRADLPERATVLPNPADFAFESTLSGLVYLNRLKRWKAAGYRIEIVYLRLRSPQLALRRIAARVKQGGHNVPRADVLRRFTRSWTNFQKSYRLLADTWSVYDNSGRTSQLLERGP